MTPAFLRHCIYLSCYRDLTKRTGVENQDLNVWFRDQDQDLDTWISIPGQDRASRSTDQDQSLKLNTFEE